MMASHYNHHHHHHHLQINTFSSVQSTVPPPPPLPYKPQTEKPILLPLAVIAGLVVAQILLLIFTVLRKCLNLCCNHETLNNQSPSCTTPSSIQNPKKPEPLGFISVITYNSTPSDPSDSSPEIFGHTSCSICLGDYENGDKVAVLRKCKHVFHEDCIRQWLPKMSVLCPVCRDPVMDLKAASNSQGNRLPSSSGFVFGFGMHHQRQFV